MEIRTEIDIPSEHDLSDIELCEKVGAILDKHYGNHPWMVGCNHKAGTVHIELAYPTAIQRRFPYGFLLHISSLKNHDILKKKVIWAGGEILERYNLPRGKAGRHAFLDAKANGLDVTNAVTKSRNGSW